MTDAVTMMNKMGKKKFIELATRSQPKETGAYLARLRRFGKNIKHKMCEHGVWIIENYVKKSCEKCGTMITSTGKHFEPYFNAGLGAWIDSKGSEKKIAKRLGLREAGNTTLQVLTALALFAIILAMSIICGMKMNAEEVYSQWTQRTESLN